MNKKRAAIVQYTHWLIHSLAIKSNRSLTYSTICNALFFLVLVYCYTVVTFVPGIRDRGSVIHSPFLMMMTALMTIH